MTQVDFYVLLPLIILVAWASALLLADLFIPRERKWLTALMAAFGLALTLGFTLSQFGRENTGFNNMVVLDGFSVFVNTLLLVTGLLGVALAYGYIKRMGIERGEYYTLMLFSISGMMLMAQAADLITFFLALELLSLPLYVLSAFARPKAESEESGLKYFLLGAFSSGFVLYGIALVYGATGSTALSGIVAAASAGTSSLLLTIGAALILVGLGFKVAAVPFHMWTPDVYQGAPTAVTAFMAAGAKVAGFAALLRVFSTAFPSIATDLTPILWAISALTMIVGNLIAISQTDIKRMLAYSSIAHAGYILMAFVPYGDPEVASVSIAAGLFYLVAYAVTNFGTWGVVIALEQAEGNPSTGSGQRGLAIADYAGLGKKYPALAAAMTVFMLSLIGFPPTLGLVGKFYLFRAVLSGGYIGLAIIGVATSLISAYYYLRVVVTMYMQDGEPETEREFWLGLTTAGTAVVTVVLSLIPQGLFAWASQAVLKLF
ncbi:MAG: NADH-quinone oxidoreductase subunit N [Anaerolineales bacterium]